MGLFGVWRKFNGKKFRLIGARSMKCDAQLIAREYRRRGQRIRIARHEGRWGIWRG